MKNKYVKRSKISEAKFRNIIMYFSLELDSQKIAALTSVNRNTINRYLARIRGRIVELCENQAQAYHTGMTAQPAGRTDGTDGRDRGSAEDGLPVFGIRSHNDHIYTRLFPNGIRRKLRRIVKGDAEGLRQAVPLDWHSYDGIVDLNGRWHYRLSPVSPGVKSIEDSHDAVDAFLGFARKRLTTFQRNGNDHFNLYLKECEFRFNHRNTDLYQLLLKRFRENPLA
jgi:transposase